VFREKPKDYKDTLPSNPVDIGVSSHPLMWLSITEERASKATMHAPPSFFKICEVS